MDEPNHNDFEAPIFGWLEGILFACGDAVASSALAAAAGLTEEEVLRYLAALQARYGEADRGLRLVRVGENWQLSTKPSLYPVIKKVQRFGKNNALSRAAMETLAIIAYRQPVTRVDVERIRGVSSASSIKNLLDHELIAEAGRKEAPGRPFFYVTTPAFLKALNIESLGDLPPVADFKVPEEEEAPAETQEDA